MTDQSFTWQSAERLAAAHMVALGYGDARVTGAGADRGLDVVAESAVAQVKLHAKPTGRPDVQRLVGAAGGRTALFYASAGFSAGAVEYATESGVQLWRYTTTGAVSAANDLAHTALLRYPAAATSFATGWDARRRLELLSHAARLNLTLAYVQNALHELNTETAARGLDPDSEPRASILKALRDADRVDERWAGPKNWELTLAVEQLDAGDQERIKRFHIEPFDQDFNTFWKSLGPGIDRADLMARSRNPAMRRPVLINWRQFTEWAQTPLPRPPQE